MTQIVKTNYVNKVLIPTLCRKAGVPTADVRGNITSHRGRSTIASQLFNSKEPMTLFELQEWLGHSTPAATQHYAKITPIKLAKSYADASYFARNLRAIEVLVDQEIVRTGRAATEPWKFYDLGHGYCTYDFFDQGVSVFREEMRSFSVGDRIQFTAPANNLRVANRELGTIENIEEDGRLHLKIDGGRSVELDPRKHLHLDHGYAMTSHSSQGQTADRVLIHVDTELGAKALLNSRMAYVSVSRGRQWRTR